MTLTHKDGYDAGLSFMEEGQQAQGSPCEAVTVKFSSYKTGIFTYDRDTGLYKVEEYGAPYVDGNTGEQVAVKNVLVLYTDVANIKGDDKGRLTVRTTGTGTGHFLCDGTVQNIKWSKKDNASPMTYTTEDGQPLKLGVGHSYVNVVGASAKVTFEGSSAQAG